MCNCTVGRYLHNTNTYLLYKKVSRVYFRRECCMAMLRWIRMDFRWAVIELSHKIVGVNEAASRYLCLFSRDSRFFVKNEWLFLTLVVRVLIIVRIILPYSKCMISQLLTLVRASACGNLSSRVSKTRIFRPRLLNFTRMSPDITFIRKDEEGLPIPWMWFKFYTSCKKRTNISCEHP